MAVIYIGLSIRIVRSLTINFNQKPSDEAVLEIIESINKVKVKFKLNFEITSKETTTV